MCLSCTDRWRSEDFYIHVLGFQLFRAAEEPGACRWYQLGDITIIPNASRPMPTGFYPEQATFLLCLETDNVHRMYDRCVNAGVTIEYFDEKTVLEITDPDGLPIEINQVLD